MKLLHVGFLLMTISKNLVRKQEENVKYIKYRLYFFPLFGHIDIINFVVLTVSLF